MRRGECGPIPGRAARRGVAGCPVPAPRRGPPAGARRYSALSEKSRALARPVAGRDRDSAAMTPRQGPGLRAGKARWHGVGAAEHAASPGEEGGGQRVSLRTGSQGSRVG